MASIQDTAGVNNNHSFQDSTNDDYTFKKNNGQDIITDFGGTDYVILEGVNSNQVTFVLSGKNSEDLKLTGYNGLNSITIKNFFYSSSDYKVEGFYFNDVQLNLNDLQTKPLQLSLKEYTSVYLKFSNSSIWNGPLKIVDMPNDPTQNGQSQNTITTTNFNDVIYDGNGKDVIESLNGNDILYSKAGDDKLYGGKGNDIYSIGNGAGNRYVSDNDEYLVNNDTIQFSGINLVDARFIANGDNDLTIRGNDWNSSVLINGQFSSYQTIENLKFGSVNKKWNDWAEVIDFDMTERTSKFNSTWDKQTIFNHQATRVLFNNIGGTVTAGKGSDTLIGGYGVDDLAGDGYYSASDSINSSDTIYGGGGNDTLSGRRGVDTYVFQVGHGKDVILNESEDDTSNIIKFVDIRESDVTRTRDGSDLIIAHKNDLDQITIKEYYYSNNLTNPTVDLKFDIQYATTIPTVVTGSTGNDNLYGSYVESTVNGGDGNDAILAGKGKLIANGGNGKDHIKGGINADVLSGGAGNDTILGWSGHDALNGDAGADWLYGEVGNDTLNGGAGNDALYGGAGNDTYVFSVGFGYDRIIDHAHLSTEKSSNTLQTNTAKFVGMSIRDFSFTKLSNDLLVSNKNGIDKVLIKDYYESNGLRSDQISILSFSDASIDDVAFGNSDDNTLLGGNGRDALIGYEGNDTLKGFNGNDILYGDAGADQLVGGAGNDILLGGLGNDTLTGEAGSDTLYGGDGSDADVYVIANGSGVDTIIDADDKSTNDTIRFSGVKSTATKFTRSGNDLLITGYGASTDKVVVKQYFDSSAFAMNKRFSFSDKTLTLADMQSGTIRYALNGTAVADTLKGSKLADTLNGMAGNDIIYGYEGNDSIQGGDGNDTLFGHAGADGINGNAGSDIINGGQGNDNLYGGTGNDADTYIFAKGDGSDTITDTDDTTAIDTLRFVNINSSSASFSTSGSALVISGYGASSDKVTVKQFYNASVHASKKQFQFADKTLSATQVNNLSSQVASLTSAMASFSSPEVGSNSIALNSGVDYMLASAN